MADVTIYRTQYCPYCDMAERLFESLDVDFDEIDVTDDDEKREELINRTGQKTVPQIFINGESVGGYDDVRELKDKGELQEMLES